MDCSIWGIREIDSVIKEIVSYHLKKLANERT